MENGAKTNLILNVLLLIDIGVWSFNESARLISSIEELLSGEELDNKLLLSNNPLMSIALSSELLSNIGSAKERYKEQCDSVKEALLELGLVFNSKIDDIEEFEMLINDTDFKNRTVLKIITEQKLEKLMSSDDPKAE
jgi:hypothetical protein